MRYETIEYEIVETGIGVLSLNRPRKYNAVNIQWKTETKLCFYFAVWSVKGTKQAGISDEYKKQRQQEEKKWMGQSLSGVDYQRAEPIAGSAVRSVRRFIRTSCRRHEEKQIEGRICKK
ncbi:MAG: hypothetical protein J7M20_00670 [Deltaproteobacteria bacterium]|nr:hypothetical protein [Deltaproteobacteria bacterium]